MHLISPPKECNFNHFCIMCRVCLHSIKLKMHKIALGVSLVFLPLLMHAQLQTTGGISPNDLVQNILLGGGVQVSNVVLTGSGQAYGSFTAGNTNLGLNSGILLTTGIISGPDGPKGPNNRPDAGIDNNYQGSALLNAEFGFSQPTFNATTLSFNFIPQGDSIAFRYVFGSEEYREFVGSEFNDVFGFFISGPNPSGGNYQNQNIALLPNGTKVAINNVNHLTNSQYYFDNELPSPGFFIQYDGYTRVLTARAKVVPCSTYTLRLAIADVADGIYDSGVFLEAKSFSSDGLSMYYTVLNGVSKDTLYEGCGTAAIVIKNTLPQAQNKTINLLLQGNSINGVDYQTLATQVTIPAGADSVVLYTSALADLLNEGVEFLIVTADDPNLCPNIERPSVRIPIADVRPLTVQAMDDQSFPCNNQVVILTAGSTGGVGPVTLTWSPGGLAGSPVPALVGQTTQFVVRAVDACQNSSTDTVLIRVPDVAPLNLKFSPDTVICPGASVLLEAEYGGGIGDLVFVWDNGYSSDSLRQWVSPMSTQIYTVSVADSCGNVLSLSSRVTVRVPEASFTYHYIENNTLIFDSETSPDVVSWLWNFGSSGSDTLEDPIREFLDTGFQVVRLTATNEFGCRVELMDTVYIYPPFGFYIPNTFTPNNDLVNDIFIGYGQGFKEIEWRVFDRWGQEVFVSTHIKRGWDGKRNGEPYPIGVYAYRFELVLPNNSPKVFMGHINLIR